MTVYPVKGEPEVFEGEYQWAEELHFLRIQSMVNNVKTTRLFPYQNIQNIKVMDVPEEE
jgi:hypothetical protein